MNGRFMFNCIFTAAAIVWLMLWAVSTDLTDNGLKELKARARKSGSRFWFNVTDPTLQTGTRKSGMATLSEIQSSVKVLCFVETCDKYLYTRAIVINNTWASRCDKTLFISEVENKSFPAISPPGIGTGYHALWSKTMYTFRYLYLHYVNEYHWFMKADDDTYVVVENLKLFLGNLFINISTKKEIASMNLFEQLHNI
ncbi:glycoprotein-N-acetylgalactosamine 3-beta-galactosyltransferase 1-like [Convolutriloba macropyga]|uniref:glycoprotein-N-acetylgalactosamine 3-beta-galactosyltransferase 1-like n=1 Tax=Convolutriloba macropyga TaxID=536237 RepID=UPI003F51D533